jgi:streptogramin lyase/cytochrome c5
MKSAYVQDQSGWRAAAMAIVIAVAASSCSPSSATTASTAGGGEAGTPIPGATVTGTVEAPSPFTAARVYLRNTDKRILYMVYTQQGRFRAKALFPGNYEVHVETNGLKSDVQHMVVAGDEAQTLSLTMNPTNPSIRRIVAWGSNILDASDPVVQKAALTYDEVYPPGPGRDVLERTCMLCHGENWAPGRPASREVWEQRIGRMMGDNLRERPAQSYGEGLLTHRNQAMQYGLQDRQVLTDYLVNNFGADAAPRFVKVDSDLPLDEEKLGKAMYMEYYLNEDTPEVLAQYGGNGNRRGQDPRFDKYGNVWLIDRAAPVRIVKFDPSTGEQKDYFLPDPTNGNHEILVDAEGMIWVPNHQGQQPSGTKYLHLFNPETETWEAALPGDPNNVVRNEVKFMQSQAFDSKGNVYVIWIMGGALSKFDRATGQATVFPIPNVNAIPYGTVADSKDNIWIMDWSRGGVAKFDTSNNAWTLFQSPTFPGHARRLNVDRQDNVWWGVYSAGKRPGFLTKLDQATGKMTEYQIPRRNSQVYDVSQGPDGTIWGPDFGGLYASIMNFDPTTEEFTFYPTPQDADMPKIQITREGGIWYSPRSSSEYPGLGVLYPDMDKITTLKAFYTNGPPGYPFPHNAANYAPLFKRTTQQ